jgi:hypothetical protein
MGLNMSSGICKILPLHNPAGGEFDMYGRIRLHPKTFFVFCVSIRDFVYPISVNHGCISAVPMEDGNEIYTKSKKDIDKKG